MEDKLEIYTKGTKAWFKDDEEGYVAATMESKQVTPRSVKMQFIIDATKQAVIYEETVANLEKNNFEDLPPLKNPPGLEGADDLTNLSYLHEAAVLNSVRQRYAHEIIYTYSGLVLIAMNPFRRLDIYTPEIMRQYCGRPRAELEPHLFAIAEEAYRKMINEGKNQSIIVSGESGAGKTMSAKFVMRYFAIVENLGEGSSATKAISEETSGSVEEAVLSTNPIMEAFGNAKTTRNDNSSRFGKYIEILFDRKPKSHGLVISGARIRTYLLERSRLVFQPDSERNYHIFYQLCAAAPAAERSQLGLGSWDTFFYLKQGKVGTVKGMDDIDEFAITQKSLSTVGISVSSQWDIFKICAALLHIGNIKIYDIGGNAEIKDDDPALLKTAELLQIDASTFKKWLIKKQIVTRSEKIISNAKPYQAITSRDSIAKFVYSMLFDWIVKIVNRKLDESVSNASRFIGVLDIYGFEHFHKNSFEQFCINYANEKLQQEFTRHVFRLEQEEYVAEKISWSFINFSDNQPCIDMIENKLGILDLLDEESRLPNGQDQSLIQKFYKSFSGNEHKFFSKPRFGEVEFVIRHYAVDVTYQIEGFIDKNKDTVSDEQLEMLNQTKFDFFKEIIQIESHEELTPPSKGPSRKPKKPTLGSIFKGSLIKLMETLRQTNPHYIRCIKPNQSKVAFEFEAQNVLGQLIACGVLETIKISRAGYPSKQSYNEFVNRYYLLVPSEFWKTEPRKLAERICASVIKGNDKYELGLTKVFFRAGQLAYLEKMRSIRLTKAVILIQKNVIRSYHQRRYTRLMAATKIVQQAWNDYLKMRDFVLNKKKYAAIAIQKTFRGFYARKKYKAALSLKRSQAVQQEKRNAEEAKRKADSLAAATASNGVLVDSAPLLKENEKLLDMIRKRDDQIAELMEVGNEKFSETIRKLENLVRKKDDQITTLTKENEDKSDEIKRLRETLKSAPKKIDGETALLKKEVSSLREQLNRVVASKYRSERSTEKFFNNDIDSKSASKLAPVHQINRMSMQFFNSAANVTARVAETLSRGETAETRPIRVRPIEIGDESVPKERAVRMLEATDLHEEIFDSLITNLRIPLPSAQNIATKKEIFFPAHLLGYLLTELLRNKMFDTLKEIFSQVIRAIHQKTSKYEDDFVSSFWISNNFELLCVIKSARKHYPRPVTSNQDGEKSAMAILAGVDTDLRWVMADHFNGWVREFRKKLGTMVVPAVIENQSLPGYICKQSGGIWSQWTAVTSSSSQLTIDQMVDFLSNISQTMKCYYVEKSIHNQLLTELVRIIGVSAFNHLLTRKNFCTWKRGIQIEHNVTVLESWCSQEGISDASIHLQHLMQAAKLLTLNKSSNSDINTIFERCFHLNANQIKKLLSLYHADDFDSPLSDEVMKNVSIRAATSGDQSILLALDDSAEFSIPEIREVQVIEKFIPAWIELPFIQAVLSAAFPSKIK